jgi:hypothetical protein
VTRVNGGRFVKFHINDYVTVSLTPEGQSALAEYYREMRLVFPEKYEGPGPHIFQFWDLMMVFGSRMGITKPEVFVNNKFEIRKAD